MGKYDLYEVAERVGMIKFGDNDLNQPAQGLVSLKMQENIANEQAETNRLLKVLIRAIIYQREIQTTPENLKQLEKDLEDQA